MNSLVGEEVQQIQFKNYYHLVCFTNYQRLCLPFKKQHKFQIYQIIFGQLGSSGYEVMWNFLICRSPSTIRIVNQDCDRLDIFQLASQQITCRILEEKPLRTRRWKQEYNI
jgi:hypothetical protein